MGWERMDTARRKDIPRRKGNNYGVGAICYSGPRNPDGTWMAGVARGSYKQFPFPVGAQFGELTIIGWERYLAPRGDHEYRALCRCTCGAEVHVSRYTLKDGRSTRCPACAKKASSKKRWKKYASIMPDVEHRSRLLNRLSSAIGRCHNPKNKYFKHYGERGVSVFSEWRTDRVAFLQYVQTLPGWDIPELEMDREEVDGNYEPGNIRFVTRTANLQNKRQVTTMQRRIQELEAENADLRSRLCRAEESVHSTD